MEIEILHIDACPNWREAGRLVSQALDELGEDGASVRFTLITTAEEAAGTPFAGSPTILVDGVDAFPADDTTAELACRVYRTKGRSSGVPSLSDIRTVLSERLAATIGAR
jgi:hypothetical protein